MTVILKYQRQNIPVILSQIDNPTKAALLDIIAAYEDGVDVSEALANWGGTGGTCGDAIAEYLAQNHKPKTKTVRKRARKTEVK